MPEKALTEPSPSDWDRWEARLLNEEEPSAAAKAERQTCSRFRRQDPGRHKAALDASKEARGYLIDRIVEADVIEVKKGEPRFKPEASDSAKQFFAKRWQPAYGTRVTMDGELEVTQPDVSLAIDRFTAGLVRAIARAGEGSPALEPGRPDESPTRLRVAEMDRTD